MVLAKPLPGQDAEDEDFQPLPSGLVIEWRLADGHAVHGTDAILQASRRTAPGQQHALLGARWSGRLFSIVPGAYRLKLYGVGRVRLTLAGEALLDEHRDAPGWYDAQSIDLEYGYHPIQVECDSHQGHVQLALFWEGPGFQLEPVPASRLFLDSDDGIVSDHARGESLVRALRCGACHAQHEPVEPVAAPALSRLARNVERDWLVDWLAARGPSGDQAEGVLARRMPYFDLSPAEVEAIADFLLDGDAGGDHGHKIPTGSGEAGKQRFHSIGCLACHQVQGLGQRGLFDGGSLTQIGAKRPPEFFERWLRDPAALNADHRMPVFELSAEERHDLACYLSTLGAEDRQLRHSHREDDSRRIAQGRRLIEEYRCTSCHRIDGFDAQQKQVAGQLGAASDWNVGCIETASKRANQPRYQLSALDRRYVRDWIADCERMASVRDDSAAGRHLLVEHNCLACHDRDLTRGLSALMPELAKHEPAPDESFAGREPPALTGVGDKLHGVALREAIARAGEPLRPWLDVQMPRFRLDDGQRLALADYLISRDRIPQRSAPEPPDLTARQLELAGKRLVTADGFGCTSCHQIGSVMPEKVAPAERGANLSMLAKRVRPSWFDRWVRNPVRMVPRMEMPSIRAPARGVLDERLDHQLAAVWHVLNRPGFEPPPPGAIRVVRRSHEADGQQRAAVLTDVTRTAAGTIVKPLIIGLPNRHNVLIDLRAGRLANWWIGDVARQRTAGKTWYWETAGSDLVAPAETGTDLRWISGDRTKEPLSQSGYVTELDRLEHIAGGVRFSHRLRFDDVSDVGQQTTLLVQQSWTAIADGMRREVVVGPAGARDQVEFSLLPSIGELQWNADTKSREIAAAGPLGEIRIRLVEPPEARIERAGGAAVVRIGGPAHRAAPHRLVVEYLTDLAVDRFPEIESAHQVSEPVRMDVAPGFEVTRLPLPTHTMPTGLAWRGDGTLVFTSLKGRVWLARDRDGDGLEDQQTAFSDELACPYGVAVHGDAIDVINKYALLRLYDEDHDDHAERIETLASGWGHTDDYHDWAVGLPRDEAGNYYIALPCQQDDRHPAEATLRGTALRVVPRTPTPEDPRQFAIETISAGLRFPMGLARNRRGMLFATDNQGNYNPFNELNHLLPGERYGFINQVEKQPGFNPPFRDPAICIPHPWMRSVNGICFLETPPAARAKVGGSAFGAFEGHLVGCEYDTRRLVRMSLERVGETWQGAVYPLTLPAAEGAEMLEGPIVCAVAPDGDLYVGNIRDSGWGGGTNSGSIVRLRLEGQLPAGIAEVRAAPAGLLLEFTAPLDAHAARSPEHYTVSSFRRISTPAYGGDDVDRRRETIRSARVSGDSRRVHLDLGSLRAGHVYEVRVGAVAEGGAALHPAEAYYTLHEIPAGD